MLGSWGSSWKEGAEAALEAMLVEAWDETCWQSWSAWVRVGQPGAWASRAWATDGNTGDCRNMGNSRRMGGGTGGNNSNVQIDMRILVVMVMIKPW